MKWLHRRFGAKVGFVQSAIILYKLTATDMGEIKSIKSFRGIREIDGEINSSGY